jgi:hypothetical protein
VFVRLSIDMRKVDTGFVFSDSGNYYNVKFSYLLCCLKKKKNQRPKESVHAHNPSIWEAVAQGS